MKECAYCGRENDDDAVQCRECGTAEFKGDITAKAHSEKAEEPNRPRYQIPPLSPANKQHTWATLITCGTLVEADLVVCQLEAAGITTFIPDQSLMLAVGWNLNTYGYVRVQVSPKDYEAARELIASNQANG
jgi:hypothetical protein